MANQIRLGIIDVPNQLCHKSAPGAAEECGGLPCRRLQINLIASAQSIDIEQYLCAQQSLTSGQSCVQIEAVAAKQTIYAVSCFAAMFSSSFDATDRLDIGLFDLTSPVSIPDLFTSGEM